MFLHGILFLPMVLVLRDRRLTQCQRHLRHRPVERVTMCAPLNSNIGITVNSANTVTLFDTLGLRLGDFPGGVDVLRANDCCASLRGDSKFGDVLLSARLCTESCSGAGDLGRLSFDADCLPFVLI